MTEAPAGSLRDEGKRPIRFVISDVDGTLLTATRS